MTKVVQNTIQSNNSYEKSANNTNCCEIHNPQKVRIFSSFLDTLAQPSEKYRSTLQTLVKRAGAKWLQRSLILKLIDLNSPLKKSYWNTWHCSNILLQEGKKIVTKYCNNRWCPVCNRIRTAKLINGYLPEFKKMVDPRFVTLTIPNVPAHELRSTFYQMVQEFNRIRKVLVYQNIRINAIRKLECTYNEVTNTYHPHYHLILEGEVPGSGLISEWLKRFPDAEKWCQDNKAASEGDLIELCKYSAKLFSKKQTGKEDGKTIIEVNPVALDVIYQAMYRIRTLQSMGWIKKISEDINELDSQVIEDLQDNIDVWTWEQDISDWVNSSGELLTGCEAYKQYEVRFSSG